MPLVYQQLRKLASICLNAERPDHTLRATAQVHEAYIMLLDPDVAWQDRVHFFAVSARLLRRVLVRAHHRQKRGGAETISVNEAVMIGPQTANEILALDEALQRLAAHDPRMAIIRNGSFSRISILSIRWRPVNSKQPTSPAHRLTAAINDETYSRIPGGFSW